MMLQQVVVVSLVLFVVQPFVFEEALKFQLLVVAVSQLCVPLRSL